VKHEKFAKSFIKYRTSNALDVTEDFVLFHVSSDSNSSDKVIGIMKSSVVILSTRKFVLRCKFI